ncbi:MAG: GlmU family protein [Saprospiraceae bacterium]|nr:GlmU family protein [Saprospiraceae bacterium]
MNNLILFDSDKRDQLLPLTYTRPVCEIRVGILTIREKWSLWMDGVVSYITQDYLSEKFPINVEDRNWVSNGSILPNELLCLKRKQLKLNEAYMKSGELIAARLPEEQFHRLMNGEDLEDLIGYELENVPFIQINQLWDIYKYNSTAIQADYDFLTRARSSQPISPTNRVIDPMNIFIEEGARVECSNLNASRGPIYIGKYSEVMEGSNIRGPFALCDHSQVKMGAKIYGATTIGPYCKVGGEITNSVMFGFSNKAHDGYLGNSVIGEWCNLGADTNNSNLKNNYSEVKLWNYKTETFKLTGETFVGLFMGDHSKAAINTMFNTGTLVGVSANIFSDGFPRNFIPSFSWGGKQGFKTYKLQEAFETMDRVMARRDKYLNETERQIYTHIFEESAKFRTWDKIESDT